MSSHPGADLHFRLEGLSPRQNGRSIEPAPVWFAALIASRCQAKANGNAHSILWARVSDRAVYTNTGADAELIEPLGVELEGGHTVAVSWLAGETAYRVEVYPQSNLACA